MTSKKRTIRNRHQQLMDATNVARVIIDDLQKGADPTLATLKAKLKRPKASLMRDLVVLREDSPNTPMANAIDNWHSTFNQTLNDEQRRAVIDLAFEVQAAEGRWGFTDSSELAMAMGINPFTLHDWAKKFRPKGERLFFNERQRFADDPEGLLTDALNSHVAPLPKSDIQAMRLDLIAERLEQIRNMD